VRIEVVADASMVLKRLSTINLDVAINPDGGLSSFTRIRAGSAPKPKIPPLPWLTTSIST